MIAKFTATGKEKDDCNYEDSSDRKSSEITVRKVNSALKTLRTFSTKAEVIDENIFYFILSIENTLNRVRLTNSIKKKEIIFILNK